MPGPPTATSWAPVASGTRVLQGGASGGFRESQRVSEAGSEDTVAIPMSFKSPQPRDGVGGPLGADLSFWLLSPFVLISFKRKEKERKRDQTWPVDFFYPVDALNSPIGAGVALPILQMRKQAQTRIEASESQNCLWARLD